ncbi:hypothetical protein OHC33_005147 [Knufia fluminis]|uniref:DNA/RNA-binding domain-containing protein n=1 Tax=Knufia fluminis TaxID=191047 RepID=A0AAN8F9F5_9EURO|nr:hypothetical protein OHC33_005147 [Knufia fluminis]
MSTWFKGFTWKDAAQKAPVTAAPSDHAHTTKIEIQDEDPMLVEATSTATPELITDQLEHQKLEGGPKDNGNASLDNYTAALPRKNKRPNPEEMSDILHSDMKKRKSPSASSNDLSLLPDHVDGTVDHSDSAEVPDNSSAFPDTFFDDDTGHPPPGLLRDLETRAITVSQLIQEVKGIYAGLVMVEKKCIEIVSQQAQNPTKLSKEQWQALIALHRTLLNEHHDFFSASHHPVTETHELRELAARYAMPARMWRHGIHAFLELLRHRLPESLEHMLSFVYLSYSMMALLMETVPDFLETWIECLGDLARYRMAIEEADLRDREIWSSTARTWYNQAADLSPNTGRIQHHLAVLARPNIVQQLFLYSKALVAAIPFKNAGESILLLFNPLLDQPSAPTSRYQPAEFSFVCAAAILFKRRSVVEFEMYRKQFASHLEGHLARSGSRFKVQGPELAGALFAMMMDFGNADNQLFGMIYKHQQHLKQIYCENNKKEIDKLPKDFVANDPNITNDIKTRYWKGTISDDHVSPPALASEKTFSASTDVSSYVGPMLYQVIADVASHIGNKNVVPFMHMVLAYLLALTWVPGASVYIETCIPWNDVAQFLNTVGRSGIAYDNIESSAFPKSFGGSKRQLPEDFSMRGLMAMTYYYEPNFFDKDALVDEDERLLEQPSHQAPRVERCLWAGIQLAETTDRWLSYDRTTKQFSTTAFSRDLKQP